MLLELMSKLSDSYSAGRLYQALPSPEASSFVPARPRKGDRDPSERSSRLETSDGLALATNERYVRELCRMAERR
jgi:hypothetical protein